MSYDILVVDDEPDIVELMQNRLEAEGFRVDTAYDATEAMDKIKLNVPDLVTLDILMPGIIGDEGGYGASLCDVLKDMEEYKSLPIVMISALERNTRREVEEMVKQADAYFTKPFDSGQVISKIKELIQLRKKDGVR